MTPPVASAPVEGEPGVPAGAPAPLEDEQRFPAAVHHLASLVRARQQAEAERDADPLVRGAREALQRAQESLAAVLAPHEARLGVLKDQETATRGEVLKLWPEAKQKTIRVDGHEVVKRTLVKIRVNDTHRALHEFQRLGVLPKAVKSITYDDTTLRNLADMGLLDDVRVIPSGAPDSASPVPLLERVEAHSIAITPQGAA